MLSNDKEIQRRTVLKGAAWSVPVIAVAAASPAFGATGSGQGYDVQVSATCTGNYDLDGLLAAIRKAIPLVGSAVTTLVQSLLHGLGLDPVSTRGFLITAKQGTIPAGTQFKLTPAPGLITLNSTILQPILQAGALGLVSIDNSGTFATVKTLNPITEGHSSLVDLNVNSAVKVTVGGDSKLALDGVDSPSNSANAGANEATLSLISVDTDLGHLIDLSDPLFTLIKTVLAAVKITIQLCPGQPNPVKP